MAADDNILTPKQERFCQEYVKDLNATHAAKAAGYSAKTAEVQGSRVLGYAKVRSRIQELMDRRAEKAEVSAEWILKEILRVASVDLSQCYGEDGQLLHPKEMPNDVRRAISAIDVHKDFTEGVEIGETRKVKLYDKLKALELLGRHLKMFKAELEISGKLTLAELVVGSYGDGEEK